MPKQNIQAEILSRTFGISGAGVLRTCRRFTWTLRRDAAGSFTAEFPASDKLLSLVTLKNSYLRFYVGGGYVFLGLVERKVRSMDSKGRKYVVISGRCQLAGLAENTVGDLQLADAGVGVNDAPFQIIGAANVPNQTFTLDTTNGYATTASLFYKQLSGETALSALVKVAEELGEHFRVSPSALLEVVWMRTDTPDAPIRLVESGGSLLHQNDKVAIVEEIEADENGERMVNRIYAFGAGISTARLTLENATLTLPAGYSIAEDTKGWYIQNDAQQGLPSLRRAISKQYGSIGLVDDSIDATIEMDDPAFISETTIIVEALTVDLPDNAVLDRNGLGVDFVTVNGAAGIGSTSVTVDALTFDILTTDSLRYVVPISAGSLESAANALAAAALADLQRLSDPATMVGYKLRVRGLPDDVYVGMKIPVHSQAPGFEIDDDLIILEITRSVDRNGRTPATLKVVPVDWFAVGDGDVVAAGLEQLRVALARPQPVAVASVVGLPTAIADNLADVIDGAAEQTTPTLTDKFALVVSGVLKWMSYTNLRNAIRDYYNTVTATLTNKTLTAPVIADFTNMAHDHTDADDGGQLGTGALVDDAVTFAKMQNIATDSVLGRATAGTGDIELITLTAFARSLIDDVAASNARTTLGLGTIAVEAETNYLLTAGTRILSADWDIGEDRRIKAEALRARDAEGLLLEDDGANGYIHLKDSGEIEVRRDSVGILLNLAAEAITEGGTLFQTGFRRESDGSIRFAVILNAATSAFMGTGVNGDSFRRWLAQADGKLLWGDGTATRDTNLYRPSADLLATDDSFRVGAFFRLVDAAATIATGAITITSSLMTVDTEAAAATDDLDTINGGAVDGTELIIRTTNDARDVVVRHNGGGTGNIRCAPGGANFTLASRRQYAKLVYFSADSVWIATHIAT